MSEARILAGLNEQQREAVTAGDGPVLVVAGPGSGKTRVITHRIAYLIETKGVPAFRILAVTFTNKAARDMEPRITRLLGESGLLDGLTLGTFHAVCARILRYEAEHIDGFTNNYAIYDTDDQIRVMKQVIVEMNLDPKKNTPRAMLNQVSAAKNELIRPADFEATDYKMERVRRCYERYDELLRENNARDFDDLLTHTVWLLQEHDDVRDKYQHRYQHILIDEFQDTNMAQYMLVKELAGKRRNVFAVGDPHQSIYGFRGADYLNMQRFQNDFGQSVELTKSEESTDSTKTILVLQNYRSHQAILNAAMGVIKQNTEHPQMQLVSDRKEGPLLEVYEAYNEDDEARYVVDTIAELIDSHNHDPGDFAIMYRTNAQSRALEDAFRRANRPYRVIGATAFYGRKEIKDVVAYLRVVLNPEDNFSLQRIINVPTRGIGTKTLETLEGWAQTNGLTVPEALALLADTPDSPLNTRARNALVGFYQQVESWRAERFELSAADLVTKILNDTGYLDYLYDGTEIGDERIENVLELRGHAEKNGNLPLVNFLEDVSLVSDLDLLDGDQSDPRKSNAKQAAPSLLTFHAAKGTEYPVVFLVGLEENIMPHARSIAAARKADDPDATTKDRDEAQRAIEEERRLMYVGITRAEQRLYLTYAQVRSLYGDSRANLPSRFLYDIPEKVRQGAILDRRGAADVARRSYDSMTTWERRLAPSSDDEPRARPTGKRNRKPATGKTSRPTPLKKPTRFKGGDTVYHRKYGEGVVITSQMRGDIEEVNVMFPGIDGDKTIMADFLKPTGK